ncbi:MAG: DUF971 domain-containing protein [Actinomycetota bacterium]|nr:DUF971 domain-containing protein [Actinomycetota bacterium]
MSSRDDPHPDEPQPLRVDVGRAELSIEWTSGKLTRFDLVELRRACTCASCTELRAAGETIWPRQGSPKELIADQAELVGAWGLSIRWNDGHETGVYSWDMLRSWRPPQSSQ